MHCLNPRSDLLAASSFLAVRCHPQHHHFPSISATHETQKNHSPTRCNLRASAATSLALPLRSTINMSALHAANGEGYAPLPDPLCARLLPRLACALNRLLFVHFVQSAQAPPALVRRSKNAPSKIVRVCAHLRNPHRGQFDKETAVSKVNPDIML